MSETAQQSGKRQTVTIMCKMPHGFIMQLDEMRKETPPQGGKEVDVYYPVGEQVRIIGSNGRYHGLRTVAGYGVTEVDAGLWEKWRSQKARWEPLQKGLVFASPTADKAEGQAKEQRDLKSGLEPLNQDKPGPGIEKSTD